MIHFFISNGIHEHKNPHYLRTFYALSESINLKRLLLDMSCCNLNAHAIHPMKLQKTKFGLQLLHDSTGCFIQEIVLFLFQIFMLLCFSSINKYVDYLVCLFTYHSFIPLGLYGIQLLLSFNILVSTMTNRWPVG